MPTATTAKAPRKPAKAPRGAPVAPKASKPKKAPAKPKKAAVPKPKKAAPPKPRPAKNSWAARPKSSRAKRGCRGDWRRKSSRKRGGTTVLHSCGHEQQHAISGTAAKREQEIKFFAGRECTSCWSAKQAEEWESLCGVPCLPPLTGSIAQVPWARTLRAKVLCALRAKGQDMDLERRQKELPPALERFLAVAIPPMLKKTLAKFWIDNREDSAIWETILSSKEWAALESIMGEAALAPDPVVVPF